MPDFVRVKRPQIKSTSDRDARLRSALREAHRLLEAYGPTWYTEALKRKIEAALKGS
jgi:hypothetical protein